MIPHRTSKMHIIEDPQYRGSPCRRIYLRRCLQPADQSWFRHNTGGGIIFPCGQSTYVRPGSYYQTLMCGVTAMPGPPCLPGPTPSVPYGQPLGLHVPYQFFITTCLTQVDTEQYSCLYIFGLPCARFFVSMICVKTRGRL